VFGGSYAGNMAAWARLKYPHLIQVLYALLFTSSQVKQVKQYFFQQGALASSAPVLAKADFYGKSFH
jgi:hypothetical protein